MNKKLIISILLCLFSFWTAQALAQTNGWVLQSPPEPRPTLRDIYVFDTNTAIAVGYYGTVIKTTNGGTNWTVKSSGTSSHFYSVHFVDASTGWAVGKDGRIIKTTDGGENWTIQSSATSYDLHSVHFIDTNNGWAVGYEGTILKTSDGGTTWIVQTSGTWYKFLEDVHFFNENTGVVVGYSRHVGKEVFLTTDGGENWTGVDLGVAYVKKVHFINDMQGWAVGITASSIETYISPFPPYAPYHEIEDPRSTVWKTTDGGSTWSEVILDSSDWLYEVFFADLNIGWAVGEYGKILKTTDGGNSWNIQNTEYGFSGSLYAVQFADALTGWVIGNGCTIYKTDNGGTSWDLQCGGGTTNSLYSVHFVDVSTGWAVGYKGTILKTTDGGETWTTQSSGTERTLYSVHFVDASTGWVVGSYGTILKTTDGGTSWNELTSGTSTELEDVYFIDALTGWAVGGWGGTILKTTDGGENWITLSSGTERTLYSVHFVDASTGWVVGSYGTILKTTDGGENWTAQSSGTTRDLNSVHFVDASTGWVVGYEFFGGTILKTTDGGENWITLSSGTYDYLYSVHFVDASTGWVVGKDGTILKTSDGGENWIAQSSGTTKDLNSVHFVDTSTGWMFGWAVGSYGTILHTTSAIKLAISGSVKTPAGQGIEEVTVTFSNEVGITTTDSDGNYSHEVSYGWSGTATPSKEGYTFTPESRTYSNITSDQTNQGYTATRIEEDNPPTVSITNPVDGSTVWDTGYIRATAEDDREVIKVKFYIDGELKYTDTWGFKGSYSCYWNTTSYGDGSHTLKAIAYDDYSQTAEDQITVNVDNTQTHIPESERNVLIALYNNTNGDSWSSNTNWKKEDGNFNDPGTEDTWRGITVGFGHVIEIYLSWNDLNGSIPPEIGNLLFLQELNLHRNKLTGIPSEIGNLTNLQGLDLGYNQLTGIPSEIGNLINLNSLDLSSNQLTGSIPSEIFSLTNLHSLNLGWNEFTGTIPSEIGNLTNLGSLILNGNQLTGNIPSWIFNLNKLRGLYLSSNQFTGSIPSEIDTLTELNYLDLGWNQLTGSIPSEIFSLTNLHSLNLGWNEFTGTIPSEIGNLESLKNLDLSGNELTGNIPPEIGNLSNLWSLGLSSNQLTTIPSGIGNLTNLKYLYLSKNQLTGSIPPEIGNLTSLEDLELDGNRLIGTIPSEIKNLTNLHDNYGCDIRYNALYTDDDSIRDFLNTKQSGGDWESTQTVAPTNLSATPATPSIKVSWTPIQFTSYGGGYKVLYSNVSGGPWTEAGMTENKYASEFDVTGLTSGTYYFVVQTQTDPHYNNKNTVLSEYSEEVSATLEIITPPEIGLNRTQINFGATTDEKLTESQSFMITNKGGGTLNWTASPSESWIQVSPTSGTGSGVVTVSVSTTGLSEGTYTGTITVEDPNATNSPQTVNVSLQLYSSGLSQLPFGSFDTPGDGTTGITGAIPVTGWALDDVEVTKVEIWRDPVGGEPTAANGLVYIGDAVFVEGARPDVEQMYLTYPLNYRAGWGYMILTNFLPNQGNGTYIIHALAYDKEGNSAELGTKTITCDNANAVKPFGTIDTPTQGGEASGAAYINFGWALTPQPNYILEDGSTIWVYIDSVPIGHPVYNNYREDIATLFPGYSNTNGAVGYFYIDTTSYENGVHTIAWSVEDSGGNTEGIGSRYFMILNTEGMSASQTGVRAQRLSLESSLSIEFVNNLPLSFEPIRVKRGYSREADLGRVEAEAEIMDVDYYGAINIEIREVERIEIDLGEGVDSRGYLIVGDQFRSLPIGSTLNAEKGIFSWQPGPGFIGEYEFIFIKEDRNGELRKIRVRVKIKPKFEIY